MTTMFAFYKNCTLTFLKICKKLSPFIPMTVARIRMFCVIDLADEQNRNARLIAVRWNRKTAIGCLDKTVGTIDDFVF